MQRFLSGKSGYDDVFRVRKLLWEVVATLLLMNLWLDRKRQGCYLFRCEFGVFCYALELLDLFMIVNVFLERFG
ncbi:hypothetical protein Hanom_Chr06g00488181 [Helianthus anomalus]